MAPLPSGEEEEGTGPSPPRPLEVPQRAESLSYVSSASSPSITKEKIDNHESTPPQETGRKTIHAPTRKYSSDSEMLQIPPAHQFLMNNSSNVDDSDASDGSIVFNFQASPRNSHEKQQIVNSHDRFPSFDSMASNGSFRVTGASHSSPHARIPKSQMQSTPVQFLPYDQRRKLMQKQEQVQQQQVPPSVMLQQQQQQQQQQHIMPEQQYQNMQQTQQTQQTRPPPHHMGQHHMQPPPFAMPYPPGPYMDPQMSYPHQPVPPIPYIIGGPISPQNTVSPMPVAQAPQTQPTKSNKPLKDTISTVRGASRGEPKPKPRHHSRPPSGHSRTLSGSGAPRGRTASGDSAGSLEREAPPRPQRSSRTTPLEVPPPPPAHPPPSYHIRHESSGSISSLGSTGSRGNGGEDRSDADLAGLSFQPQPYPPVMPPHQAGFMGFFPGTPLPPSNMSVEEFHHMNQAFLQRSEHERMRMQQMMRDVSPSRRPPTSPRMGRNNPSGLPSIDNDESWNEGGFASMNQRQPDGIAQMRPSVDTYRQHYPYGYGYPAYQENVAYAYPGRGGSSRRDRATMPAGSSFSSSSGVSSSDGDTDGGDKSDDQRGRQEQSVGPEHADERTTLLPPPGISTHEQREVKESYIESTREKNRRGRSSRKNRPSVNEREKGRRSSRRDPARLVERGEAPTERFNNRTGDPMIEVARKSRRKKGRKGDRKKSRRRRQTEKLDATDPEAAFSSSSSSHRMSSQRELRKLEKDRAKYIAKWRAEVKAQEEQGREAAEENRWHRRLGRCICTSISPLLSGLVKFLGILETFLANLPLTIGAVALAIATLGVVWFKFAEENLDSCAPVHFHSSQCTFPEFPGCFYCDTSSKMYKVAVNFHFTCSAIAGLLAMSFVAKILLATGLVLDEMSSPTTASPAGLLCMTTVVVFAGRGWVGKCLVSIASAVHLSLAIWFIYMALAYHIMPEPSWYPNTVGIGLTAVKTWLYYPMLGHLLMAVSLALNLFFFPVSLIRVTLNKKMSATVCWIQMSAPAISLYALTIMAQPSFVEEHPDVTQFQRVHRLVYLPCMHFLFGLACIGVCSSVQSLWVRWNDFRTKAFSPAHAAFCFPTLAHVNAIQAYRAAVNSFSDLPARSPFKIAVYVYWVAFLVSGTLATLYITAKFFYHLPGWTLIDIGDEEEPPPPNETQLLLKDVVTAGDTLSQPFVSPAVLQANETGALVMLPRGARDGRRRYRRTRRLTALGFEPIMNVLEMDHEREVLLDWVGKHPPRRRTQTLSVPGIDFNYGFGDFGAGNTGVYGGTGHTRSSTVAGYQEPRARASTASGTGASQWRYY